MSKWSLSDFPLLCQSDQFSPLRLFCLSYFLHCSLLQTVKSPPVQQQQRTVGHRHAAAHHPGERHRVPTEPHRPLWQAAQGLHCHGNSKLILICYSSVSLYITVLRHTAFSIFFSSTSGVSLQEEPGLERGQSRHPSSRSRAGLGCATRHWGIGTLWSCIELKTRLTDFKALLDSPQGDIQAKYESIDKDTPIPTDRQVRYSAPVIWWIPVD